MHAPVEADACDLVLLPANITVKGQRVILWVKKAMNGLRRAPLLWFLCLSGSFLVLTIRIRFGDLCLSAHIAPLPVQSPQAKGVERAVGIMKEGLFTILVGFGSFLYG